MSRSLPFAILASIAAALAALVAPGALAQDNKSIDAIAKEIQMGNVGAAKKAAAAYAQKRPDPDELMIAFKSVEKGGIGVGGKGSIQKELGVLSKTPLAPADLKAKSADLVQMSEHIIAIGYISERHGVGVAAKGVPYLKLANDLVAAADALKTAVGGQKAQGVQKAAATAVQVCNTCHSNYR